MAIGDCFAIMMGTAATIRQPSSGVFEMIGAIGKDAVVDFVYAYNGSVQVEIYNTGVRTGRPASQAGSFPTGYHTSILIGNTVYIQKAGTANRIAVTGVQVDA
jgi:hypothetical protein